MFISPVKAIEQGWVTFPTWMSEEQKQQCIQPNALDFTIDRVAEIDLTTPVRIGNVKADITHHSQRSVTPSQDGWWMLNRAPHDFMSDFYVNLPNEVAALVIVRSTFNRNGMFVTTGLWDSGFKGNIAGVLHINGAGSRVMIEQHVRVGQIMFFPSEKSEVLYAGGYNTANGQHWSTLTQQ